MKKRFLITMPAEFRKFFDEELKRAGMCWNAGDLQASWNHLERAHILGQPYAYHHTWVHWKMLCFGVRTKNLREVFGQIPRLLAGGVKSFVGEIPVGNTGGANVPPLRSMPVPRDLKQIMSGNDDAKG